MSPRPDGATGPARRWCARRCSSVMANPSGSSPSVPTARPTSSSTPRPAMTSATVSMPVTASPRLVDHLVGGPAVPGDAVVEDVAEAVPLRRALQGHRDHVVGAADAVREALDAGGGVGAGVEHGVHRVGTPPPALLRAVHVEGLRQRERLARCAPAQRRREPLARRSRKFMVPRTSSAPQRPQFEHPRRRGRDRALGVGAVEVGRGRTARAHASSAKVSATQSAMKVPTCGRWSRPMCSVAALLGGEDPQLPLGAVDRLLVGAVGVGERDLPVVLAVGDRGTAR